MKSVLLYMRKKNLVGTNFGKYAGFTNLVKSVGGFIERNTGDVLAKFTLGWVGLENCFEPVQAVFGGTTYLERTFVNASESDQGSFSLWVWRDSGSTKVFIFDIGDAVTADTETTRFEIDAPGRLDIYLSEFTVGPGWSVFAQVTDLTFPADEWHHIKVDFANENIRGVGNALMQLRINGAIVATDTSFTTQRASGLVGDKIIIAADHAGGNVMTGRFMEFWSGNVATFGDDGIDPFFSPRTTTDFVNGSPRLIPANVAGSIGGNFLGGQLNGIDYTIDDWNNGVNRGVLGDFTRVGALLTQQANALDDLVTVELTKEISFTDSTVGVQIVNTTTAETAAIVDQINISKTNLLQYDLTWVAAPVIGDVVEYQYDGSGNFFDTSSITDTFEDGFLSANGVALTSAGHKATITTDLSGNGWVGSVGVICDGSGNATSASNNVSVALDAVYPIVRVTYTLFDADNTITNRTDNAIRRKVQTGSADEVRCSVERTSGGVNSIEFFNRIGGTNQGGALKKTTIAADIAAAPVEFKVVDDGNQILFTCVDSGETISITNVELEETGMGAGTGNDAPTQFASLNVGTDAVNTFVGGFKSERADKIPAQTIVLTNCLGDQPANAITDPSTNNPITDPSNGDFITDPGA